MKSIYTKSRDAIRKSLCTAIKTKCNQKLNVYVSLSVMSHSATLWTIARLALLS